MAEIREGSVNEIGPTNVNEEMSIEIDQGNSFFVLVSFILSSFHIWKRACSNLSFSASFQFHERLCVVISGLL